eukprot:1834292-Prymnesium_polylepis.1
MFHAGGPDLAQLLDTLRPDALLVALLVRVEAGLEPRGGWRRAAARLLRARLLAAREPSAEE